MDFIIGIAVFFLGFGVAYKLLNSKFRKSQDGTLWDDLKENIITLFSFISGGAVVTSTAYFFMEDELRFVGIISLGLVGIYSIGTIFLTACWFDEKLDLDKRVTFKGSVIALGFIFIFTWGWITERDREAKEREDSIKRDLLYNIGKVLQSDKPWFNDSVTPENISVDSMLDPQTRFLTNCINDYLLENYSLDDATSLLWIINPRPIIEVPNEDQRFALLKKDRIKIFNNIVENCRNLGEKIQPVFRQLVDTKTFNDLRPDLAKIAREGFFSDTIFRGPKTAKKYISILNLSQGERNISKRSLKLDGKKWRSVDRKYGHALFKGIEWQYKVANCEHIVTLGPEGGFGSPVNPDEKTLAKRKKCREEKNLPTQ